ncbi:MAG: hypothetical protein KGJ41_04920, partial [Rhodospirillales bacterium]|nr:hypothetical protein [Rhodospirillales bacterium]
MGDGHLALELALHPDDAARLPGRGRRSKLSLIWHDTPAGDLQAAGLALVEQHEGRRTLWRLERLRPPEDAVAPCGTPPVALAEAADAASLWHGQARPDGLASQEVMAVCGLDAESRDMAVPGETGITARLLCGRLRAAAGTLALCRVSLAGPPAAVRAAALDLATRLRAGVPRE